MQDPSGPSREQELSELVEHARRADPRSRVADYRDTIAGFGQAAVRAVSPWLEAGSDGRFAVTIIERAGSHHGARDAAVAELRRVHATTAEPDYRQFIEGALRRLGAGPIPAPRPGPGGRGPNPPRVAVPDSFQVAPAWRDVHHVVVDHVQDSGTDWGEVYLLACARFFSGDWVRRKGGLLPPRGRPICHACRLAIERGA